MRSVFIIVNFILLCQFSGAQSFHFANRLIAYRPAPGQHINDPITGTPNAALDIINKIGNPLSLGAYGGYSVFGFNSSVVNDPVNPYGVDFIIFGNASYTHTEPGIVKVMQDVNKNGLPDDTWYEIAGSAHFTNDYVKDYSVRYLNPKYPSAADVIWTDNKGNTGKVSKNSFHTQPYYPLNDIFPEISNESISFTGSKLKGNVQTNNGNFISLPYAFGYADDTPVNFGDISGIPDNPYTPGNIEGNGGDGIDISWAIDSTGKYPDLPEIDFIMIYTAVNESAGWLGEISTDIRGIIDVDPNPEIKGPLKMILADELPSKIALKDTISIFGRVFLSGRFSPGEQIHWESLNTSVLLVQDNLLIANAKGETEIIGKLVSDPSVFVKKKVSVVVPQSLFLDTQFLLVQEGENVQFKYTILDNSGDQVIGLIPVVKIENGSIACVGEVNENKISVNGKAAGITNISLTFPDYPEFFRSIKVQVIRKIDLIQVNFSLGNEKINILPGKNYNVRKEDILSFTNRYKENFHPDKDFITLADAIVSVLNSEGFRTEGNSIAFRQDDFGGEGLYLWQVGFDWEYQYGWGGSMIDGTHAKTWFAIINNKVFASGFDTLEIFDGDRISLKHIEDDRNSWSLVRIIPDKDQITTGETVNFRSEQIDIYPGENNNFIVSGPFPVVNAAVQVESSAIYSESDQYTSYTGDFRLSFKQAGFQQIAIENSEPVMVEVMSTLSIFENEKVRIYPNPCYDWLKISLPVEEIRQVKLFTIDGKLLIDRTIAGGKLSVDMNISELKAGIYILEVICGEISFKHKICKL